MSDEKADHSQLLKNIERILEETYKQITSLYPLVKELGIPEITLTGIEVQFAIAHDELVNQAYGALRSQQDLEAVCQEQPQDLPNLTIH